MYDRAKYKEGVNWETLKDPVASIKYDGAHYYLEVSPSGTPKFISRRPSVTGAYLDRSDKLPHITSIPVPQLAGNVYNTELIFTGHDKNNIESHALVSGILNSLPPKAIATQKISGPVRVVLLDVISPKFNTYEEKLAHLKEVEKAFNKPEVIYSVTPVHGIENIRKLSSSTKERSQEGIIVTSLTKPESENYRVKIKHTDTYNLRIVNIIQEVDIHGKLKDSAGSLELADSTGRAVCNVGTGFTREMRKHIWDNKSSYMRKLIQIKAMKSTAQKLRSPVYNGEADGDIDTV